MPRTLALKLSPTRRNEKKKESDLRLYALHRKYAHRKGNIKGEKYPKFLTAFFNRRLRRFSQIF
jgi:hypothetical protein